ncbi:thiamine phosphate synthase [Helicobacter sp. MIT 99-5507]|uniref:thiamine phosphate synthase n=1 Tax=Helicobacter sp. MIT 99-5507 TaxID=152489 RepID=UPI000E1F4838|nr:thiamine phosphate synthase [Helicobacter sp. MIT 99-5507]RDU56703.1 hypothetical protein CQA42_07790 [Helicobacter sp. MIT 99-5507]
MKLDKFLITSHKFYSDIDSNISYAYDCGVSKIYLREFELSRFYIFLEICQKFNILLFVNYIDKHKECILKYAHGIHLKSKDFTLINLIPSEKLVSYSAHNLNDVDKAYNKDIDFIFLSPVFFVAGKNKPLGIEYFYNLPDKYKNKIYALGGIDSNNISMFYDTNIRGVAGIRMFLKV